MKTIIAGSRLGVHFGQVVGAVAAAVRAGIVPTEVASGCADGVDQLGEQLARLWHLPVRQFPADWKRYGRAAGRQRNLQMAVYAEALIAVWDGKSPGTRHMIETAMRMGLKVFVYRTDLEHA
ncbi:MAG TPA: hypothetical protein VFS02_22420 [Telluria sp.]|nr:hypothetical protein [Telluria sp.]